jgi:trans-aconitate 2-methyltransferase
MSLVTSAATKTKWNAADYAANSIVQQSWARELITRLNLRGNEHVLDVGCGDGKVTAEIANAVPRGSVVGIDASAEMIGFAKKTFPAKKFPNLEFHVIDARKIKFDRQCDLIFSNAALHWVDDHQAILRGMASVLRPGGRLVVSCGGKGNAQEVFVVLRPEMRLERWRRFFRRMPKPYFFYAPEDYEKWLPKFGFKVNSLKLAPKDATYTGADGFATWLRTTWIPYVQRVPENSRGEFIAAITDRYLAKHPPDAENKVYVRMVRLEIDAQKL